MKIRNFHWVIISVFEAKLKDYNKRLYASFLWITKCSERRNNPTFALIRLSFLFTKSSLSLACALICIYMV